MTLSTAPPTTTMEERSANIRTMLDQAVSPRKKPRLLTRETYLERLQTFSSKTYFGKPIGLSPIVCAARGWSNVGTDLLECSHCRAKVCVAFDEALLPSQHNKVEQHFKEQLTTKGHTTNPMCLFYNNKKDTLDDMPLYLAAVLDDEFIAWMDHPTPQTVLLERAQRLTNLVELEELPEEDDGDQKLIDQVCDKLIVADAGDDTNDSSNPTTNRTALTLALLGWTRCDTNSTESNMTLDCKLCLSTLPETTNRRLALRGHKYYCPYRCGLKYGGEPCWKTIANKAVKSLEADQEGDDYQGADATLRRIEILLAQHNATKFAWGGKC